MGQKPSESRLDYVTVRLFEVDENTPCPFWFSIVEDGKKIESCLYNYPHGRGEVCHSFDNPLCPLMCGAPALVKSKADTRPMSTARPDTFTPSSDMS